MPGNGDVVLIVPTQGSDIGSFQSVAHALKSQVYGAHATIVYAKITDNNGRPLTTLYTDKALTNTFSLTNAQKLKTVMTISHGFSGDGPNFAFGDALDDRLHQPWPRDGALPNQLSQEAKTFWTTVGTALRADGKVILLGCSMGSGDYANRVAEASGRTVYAATSSLGAGDKRVAIPTVKEIEKGKPPKIINRVNAHPSSTR